MKKIIKFVPLILLTLVCVFFLLFILLEKDPSSPPSALIDKQLPEFSTVSLYDESIKLSSNAIETYTLINFFASWCIPCSAEHSSLKKLALKEDIFLVGVNYKDTAKDASEWLNKLGNPYARTGFDSSGRIGIEWGISGVPETFIIDKNGIILNRFSGPLLDVQFEEFEKTLMGHLNES